MFKYISGAHKAHLLKIFLLIIAPISVVGQDYLWPTNASKLLTSNFCEFRPRHFHAAIDIKTWNRTGYPIVAIDDGYIMRARISAFGYGKALYLKLKDGNVVIYAHLSKFWPELDTYLDKQRKANKTYRIDRQFTSQQFPVKRGQIIGYTGKSGIGSPHLHFEIRDPQNRPINPLQYYRSIFKDNTPPRLYQAAFFPMDHRSLINLTSDTLFFSLDRQQKFQLEDTLLFTGQIGLAIKAYDQAGGASNEFSFYRANMWIDDSLVYSVQYDRFAYEQSEKVELDKNYDLWRKGQGIFHNFYIHPENNLPFYHSYGPGSGVINHRQLSEGVHSLRVEISDFSENTALFEAYFRSGSLPYLNYDLFRWIDDNLFLRLQSSQKLTGVSIQQQEPLGTWSDLSIQQRLVELQVEDRYYYTFAISPGKFSDNNILKIQGIKESGLPSFPLFLRSSENKSKRDSLPIFETIDVHLKRNWLEISARTNHLRPFTFLSQLTKQIPDIFWYPRNEETFQIHIPFTIFFDRRETWEKLFNLSLENLHYIERNNSYRIISSDQFFQVIFPPFALYDDAAVFIKVLDTTASYSPAKKYPILGNIYDVQPFTQAVDGGAWIELGLPEKYSTRSGVGLYYWDQKKGWQFIPSKIDTSSHRFKARVTSLEKFALIQDTLPPSILPAQALDLAAVQNQNGVIKFFVKDEFSGIQSESKIQIDLNGQWQLFEYDPEEDYVTIHLPSNLSGPAIIKITVEDNVGNTAKKVYSLK